jgi:hypothetical protein
MLHLSSSLSSDGLFRFRSNMTPANIQGAIIQILLLVVMSRGALASRIFVSSFVGRSVFSIAPVYVFSVQVGYS